MNEVVIKGSLIAYEKPEAIDLDDLETAVGGYCVHGSGAYYEPDDNDE